MTTKLRHRSFKHLYRNLIHCWLQSPSSETRTWRSGRSRKGCASAAYQRVPVDIRGQDHAYSRRPQYCRAVDEPDTSDSTRIRLCSNRQSSATRAPTAAALLLCPSARASSDSQLCQKTIRPEASQGRVSNACKKSRRVRSAPNLPTFGSHRSADRQCRLRKLTKACRTRVMEALANHCSVGKC